MSIVISEIVSSVSAPVGHVPVRRRVSRVVTHETRRRTVLKAIGVGALALGGGLLDLAARPAWAETSPAGNLQGWNGCGGVDYAPDPDTGGLYASWPAACNGGTYRSSGYCNSNGWHRNDIDYAPSVTYDYIAVSDRCWGGSDSRNSWRWKVTRQGTEYQFRCSDGKVVKTTTSGTSTYNTVCRALV